MPTHSLDLKETVFTLARKKHMKTVTINIFHMFKNKNRDVEDF
jgi:hypothetical protein